MGFVQLLTSLDALLYELIAWFAFFPVTLWRIVRHPLNTMRYAENQLRLDRERQYRGTVGPPIMLFLTIVVMHGVGVAMGEGTNAIIADRHGLASLVKDNTSLLLLRLVLFGLFALVLATWKVRRSGAPLDRDTLKAPFYAQCYAISPFALLVSCGTAIAFHHHPIFQAAGIAAIVAGFLFYGIVQVRWFSNELNQSYIRSFLDATIGMIISIAVTVALGLLFH